MVAFGLAHGVTTFWPGDQAVAAVGGVLCWGYLGNFRDEKCSSVGFFSGLFWQLISESEDDGCE